MYKKQFGVYRMQTFAKGMFRFMFDTWAFFIIYALREYLILIFDNSRHFRLKLRLTLINMHFKFFFCKIALQTKLSLICKFFLNDFKKLFLAVFKRYTWLADFIFDRRYILRIWNTLICIFIFLTNIEVYRSLLRCYLTFI